MSQKKSEKGLLSLEASIALTLFIFLMLFIYSFFTIFEARNAIGHAVLATANSLALDSYASETLGDEDTVVGLLRNLYGNTTSSFQEFTDMRKWYDNSVVVDENNVSSLSADFSDAIQKRFFAYLTGGDKTKADEILKRYHIKDGTAGLDFSGSYADSKDIHLSVQYTIEYEFQVFGMEGFKMEQSACSKLWKS